MLKRLLEEAAPRGAGWAEHGRDGVEKARHAATASVRNNVDGIEQQLGCL